MSDIEDDSPDENDRWAFYAESEADAARHVVARASFMTWIVNGPNVQRLYDAWKLRLGLGETLRGFTEAREHLAADLGMSPENIWNADGTLSEEAILRGEQKGGIDDSHLKRLEAIPNPIPEPISEQWNAIGKEAVRFVMWMRLGPQGTWVVEELLRVFAELHVPRLMWGVPSMQADLWWNYASPAVRIPSFETRARESVDEAKRRLDTLYQDAKRQLEGNKLPVGKLDKDDLELVQQWVQWLCRARLSRESIRSLAKERHSELSNHAAKFSDSCGCERAVRHGIDRAAFLLSLGSPPDTEEER